MLFRQHIKFNFCCYYVQISLLMSQQIQPDIFHTKMSLNALWCQITRSNGCYVIFWNIATKHWIYILYMYMDRGYCNSFYFYLWLYNYWEYVIKHVFDVEGHIILKIWLILRISEKSSCASLSTSNIEYGDIIFGFFFNPTNVSS